jgi:hypothetical protein
MTTRDPLRDIPERTPICDAYRLYADVEIAGL